MFLLLLQIIANEKHNLLFTIIFNFIHVIISGASCPMFDPPRDGILTCVKTSSGKVCALACKEGFDFSDTPPLFYVCENGAWSFVTLAPADLSVKSPVECKGEVYRFIYSITTRIRAAPLARSINRELKQTTTTTATRSSPNKRQNE